MPEVTISGVLYDKEERTSAKVVLIGEATVSRPSVPGEPPGIWGPTDPFPGWGLPTPPPIVGIPPFPTPPIEIPGLKPEHPIVLPPNTPSHPIVIPPDNPTDPPTIGIWPPLPNNDLPKPEPPPIIGCHRLVYSLRHGWALVNLDVAK